jgi:hypothetical protein
LFAKQGAEAKAVLLSIVQREVKMVWSMLGEGFDMAGSTAVFKGGRSHAVPALAT